MPASASARMKFHVAPPTAITSSSDRTPTIKLAEWFIHPENSAVGVMVICHRRPATEISRVIACAASEAGIFAELLSKSGWSGARTSTVRSLNGRSGRVASTAACRSPARKGA